ncbi:hypothetical protein RJ639_007040 [Escallonia herrerae]|uniref:Uncharacterized protein n=1 Tax=Escallonia herrerae TaxID=1293975 RepID=A0AA88VV78_9ASTE|nr:hypothetical protein RJ639_007040 [Escallonia herrerae]
MNPILLCEMCLLDLGPFHGMLTRNIVTSSYPCFYNNDYFEVIVRPSPSLSACNGEELQLLLRQCLTERQGRFRYKEDLIYQYCDDCSLRSPPGCCLGDITMATSETNPESGPVNPNMQHSGGTVYATPYVAPAHGSVGLGEKPKKFNGKDFKRWQHKMLFYLTTLILARFLQEDAPDLGENPDRQTVAAVDAWKHSDFLCKNYILNGLDNALYNVYSPMVNAKALWESLERKYKTEDAGSKKFVVGKFLDFKMVDSKTVISQVQEFQLILHDIHAEGMVLGESFQVVALIEKLPPTWKDFKNYLKHKRKEMKLEDLIVRLRIEEDNRQSEKKAGDYHQEAKANVVEQGPHSSAYRFLEHKSEIDDIHVNTIMETRNAHFFEDVFPHKVAQERNSLERTSMDQDPSQE